MTDLTVLVVAQKLTARLGQTVMTNNKPSTGGIVAGEMVASANPVQLPVMRGLCAAKGYQLPELVSPLELLESDDD